MSFNNPGNRQWQSKRDEMEHNQNIPGHLGWSGSSVQNQPVIGLESHYRHELDCYFKLLSLCGI